MILFDLKEAVVSDRGWTYCIEGEGIIKIGRTKQSSLQGRIYGLSKDQVYMGMGFRWCVPNEAYEKPIHELLNAYRMVWMKDSRRTEYAASLYSAKKDQVFCKSRKRIELFDLSAQQALELILKAGIIKDDDMQQRMRTYVLPKAIADVLDSQPNPAEFISELVQRYSSQ